MTAHTDRRGLAALAYGRTPLPRQASNPPRSGQRRSASFAPCTPRAQSQSAPTPADALRHKPSPAASPTSTWTRFTPRSRGCAIRRAMGSRRRRLEQPCGEVVYAIERFKPNRPLALVYQAPPAITRVATWSFSGSTRNLWGVAIGSTRHRHPTTLRPCGAPRGGT